MKNTPLLAMLVAAFTAAPAMAQAGGRGFPLLVVSTTVVGEDAEFGEITGGAVGSDGTAYVVDRLRCRVVAFSATGRMLWAVGRKGSGPGEYQMPYRIAVRPDGSLLVYDLATREITTLTRTGRFVARTLLPFRFHVVDQILSESGGVVVVVGYSNASDKVRRFGLHRFASRGGRLVHERSFGPLPPVRDTALLRYWGAGGASRTSNGDILYSVRLPYHIYRYDPLGRPKRSIVPPLRLTGRPEDVVHLEHDGRNENVSNTGNAVEEPGAVVEIGDGWTLSTRLSPRGQLWDLFDRSGAYAGSRRPPPGANGLFGADTAGGILWFASTHDDAPVLVRVQVSFRGAASARSAQ
jgi:hypothetical protein